MIKNYFQLLVLLSMVVFSVANTNAQTVNIGTGTSNAASTAPIYRSSASSTFNYSRYNMLYTATDLASIPAGSIITAIAWNKTNGSTLSAGRTASLNILMKNSSTTSLAAQTWNSATTGTTVAYSNPALTNADIPSTAGYWTITLTNPFVYTGGSLEIMADWEIAAGSGSATTGAFNWQYSTITGTQAQGANAGSALTGTSNLATISSRLINIQITYTVPPPCAGAPNVPVATSSVANACIGQSFNLNASNPTLSGGITYQWQSSPATSNTFTDISGATNLSYVVSSQSSATDYRLIAKCVNTNDSVISNVVSVGQNSFVNCYCNPTSTCVNEGIVNVTMGTLNNNSAKCATNGYQDFTSLGSQVSVVQGQQIAISVTDTINSNPASAGVWIDYNQNAVFDASEFTFLGSTTAFGSTAMPFTFTGNINIPAGALTGTTRMRVRGANSSTPVAASGNNGPCNGTTTVYGEYEDYLITINAGTPCTGSPNAGTVASTRSSVACSGVSFILSSSGFTSGVTGLSFQWMESTDGINFTPRGSATTDYKNDTVATISQTMYYRLDVTCTNTPSTTSSGVFTVNFTTPAIPWTENFDALTSTGTTSFPACWFKENGDWSTSAATTYNTSYSAPNHLRCAWSATNEYMWTPGFNLTANTSYDLSFYVAGDGYTGWVVDVFQNMTQSSTGATQVGTSYSPAGPTNSQVIQPYSKRTYTFVPTTSGVHYFAVRVNQPSGSPWYIAFDDFRLDLTPNCPAPQSPSSSNATTNTADLQWIEPGTASQWQVEYGLGNFTIGTGTRVTANANSPYTLGGLSAGQTYTYFVRSICNAVNPGGDTSAWSVRSASFATIPTCLVPTALGASNVTATSIDLNWTENNSATLWEIEYGVGNTFTPGTGTRVTSNLVTNPYTLSGINTSSQYSYFVRSICGPNDTSAWSARAAFNDGCSGAIPITLNAPAMTYSNVGATDDPLPSVTCGSTTATTGNNKGIWFSFTAPYTGTFTFSGCDNAQMDNYARIYEGTCGSFTACAGFNDDDCPLTASPLFDFAGVANTTYYVLLGNYGTGTATGTFPVQIITPLDIKLGNIAASNVGASNKIVWNTHSEEKSDRFELERSIDGGKTFSIIYKKGANGEASRYTYMDNNAAKGINYYRLRLINGNGSVSYSETVSATVKSTGFEVSAFPNPVSDDLTISVSGTQGANASVQVTDLTGKIIRTVIMNGATQKINMNGLANGIYLIKYADANHTQTIRVTKQ